MTLSILINGVQPASHNSALDVMERGFQYGDGLFETMAAFDGECPWFEQHYARLCKGCDRLAIPIADKSILFKEIKHCINGLNRCVVKVIYSRGTGGRGYRPANESSPTRVVMALSWPDYSHDNWRSGIRLYDCKTTLSCQALLAGTKNLNRLEQVLAIQEWDSANFSEGLMKNDEGSIVEGVMSNIFFVKEGTLFTPDLARCGVEGVMRAWVMQQSTNHHFPVTIGTYTGQDLLSADEIFMTNSLIGLWPVREFKQQHYSVGPVYHELINELTRNYPVINA